MTRPSVLTLALALLTLFCHLSGKSDAASCTSLNIEGTLTVAEGETCDLDEDIAADTVIVLGHMRVPSGSGSVRQITCATFRLEAGGTVDLDGVGHTQGPGVGNSDGSGGSYGGRGGSPKNKLLTVDDPAGYGSYHAPTDPGSGGGGTCGANGGGAIKITASGTVEIDGILSANGKDASGSGVCGGGSGGSIQIVCDHMDGNGVISARGGKGINGGGGGAGGRIAIHHETQDFRGTTVADGGIADPVANLISISAKYASSTQYSYSPSWGYIGANSNKGWRPSTFSGSQYLEFRFSAKSYVTSMEIKGGSYNKDYVKLFNVRYYNDTAGAWLQLGDENYQFDGNTDYTNIKSVHFPWPILATMFRVYPLDYFGGIEMSMRLYGYTDGTTEIPTGISSPSNKAGAGGPGTIFFNQGDSPGIGKLIIDNFAKNPYVYKTSSSTKEFDIMSQGAAAWVMDATEALDEILVNDGSHLVLGASTRVSNIIGDGRSMTHIAPDAVVTLGHDMTTHCYVYEGGVLNLTTASISIGEYLYVKGRLDSTPNAVVTLTKPATVYFASQDITIAELTIEEEALMSVTSSDDAVFNLTLEKLEIHGEFTAGPTDLYGITDFLVGTSGEVTFDPVDEDERLGDNIEIRGTVTLGRHVSFKRPCVQLLIDFGRLSWPVSDSTIITMECERVVINGPFTPGIVRFGLGIEEFSVGNSGTFTFTAHGKIYMNGVAVAGTMNVQNLAEFRSNNGTNGLIDYFVIHSPNGKVYLDKSSKPMYNANGDEMDDTCNILRADHLIIDGVLSAKNLDIADGIEELYIDDHGAFTFTPCAAFKIHEIYTNGSMASSIPLTLQGTNLERVHDITIDTHGSIKLDNAVLSSKSWTGTSRIGVHSLKITGTLDAGRLENRIAEDGAWDSLTINKGGTFNFEPDGDFLIDSLSINGYFRAYKYINIRTTRPEQDLKIFINTYGKVYFDSLKTSGWTDLSTLTAYELKTASNSYFSAGDTKFDLQRMIIAGTMLAFPSEDISAPFFEVSHTGSVDISRTVNIDGQTMDIKGTLDVSYQHTPESPDAGCNETYVTYDSVTVSGTFKAGSLHVESKTLTVSGALDVSGGGYQPDLGPGAGQINSIGASGASHGSRGGRGHSYIEALDSHGTIYVESTWGSGGGSNVANGNNGGRGGGYAQLYVKDAVVITGRISANGLNAKHSKAGGGSGGNIYITTEDFTLTGWFYCNGGSGYSYGGGGAGGRVTVYFTGAGDYHSGRVEAKGGSGGTSSSIAEPGGPGVVYFEGTNIKNLRVDNRCQLPKVTEPVFTATTAGAAEYETYTSKGATAWINAPEDDHTFEFTHIEIYGGAHLWVKGTRTRINTERIYGDDTGHLHIGPGQTLEITEESQYRRANVTYEVYLYEGATWILPESIVEFRENLDQKGLGMAESTYACDSGIMKHSSSRLWGTVIGNKAHLLVSTGALVTFGYAGERYVKFSNLTIQDGGILEFVSDFASPNDIWELEVGEALYAGMITIEAGGLLKARNLEILTEVVKVDKKGTLSLTGQGLMAGPGEGTGRAGGGYGGRGGAGNTAGEPGLIYGRTSLSEIHFGSGGSSATASYGAGGGMLFINNAQQVIVEGTIEANGAGGTSSIGAGSGGTIRIFTDILEGSGSVQVVGGAGSSNTGGGGGGRLQIKYDDVQYWYGDLQAEGGTGYTIGGAGTVYLEDSRTDNVNKTLIINNRGRTVTSPQMSSTAYSAYQNEASRTWIPSTEDLSEYDSIRILGNAHLALHPDLTSEFELRSDMFEGDKTGNLHIGPGQTAVVNHPDNMEFLVNVYVYEGGTLVLPPEFICYDVSFYIWGTLGVYDMTVGKDCHLYLGSTGSTKRSGFVSDTGIFDFDALTVAAGGEVTPTHDLTGENNLLKLAGIKIQVQGGGIIHAIHIDIQSTNLRVDDLGEIIGDYHTLACDTGNGVAGSTGSGAGHAGRGARGSTQSLTGAPYDCLTHPVLHGCRGGSASVSGSTVLGGRGGGTIYLKNAGTLHVDGVISANGETGTAASGGGSGGAILMEEIGLIKGYGNISVTGGSSLTSNSAWGGGGSGGIIALHFAKNFTYSGSWDVYGGLSGNSANSGSSGMAYFYHTGYDHTTLYLNNINRGAAGDTNTILNYDDLTREQGHTWILGTCDTGASYQYEFNELQIYGQAHLAIESEGGEADIFFHNMIGDRSGAIHIGPKQVMDLERPKIDVPFHVHVYRDGFLGMAPDTNVHGVNIFLNGTLAHIDNLTLHHGGNLWLYNDGRTEDQPASHYNFQWVHVKDQGYLHMITDPVWEKGIHFSVIKLHIDGGGLARGTHLYFHAENISIDSGGTLNADELGYSVEHKNMDTYSLFGTVNPGLGYSGSETGSGAGHGGSGGLGECEFPYI